MTTPTSELLRSDMEDMRRRLRSSSMATLVSGLAGEGADAGNLVGGYDLASDEDVLDASLDHDLGLGDLGGADSADGAAGLYLFVQDGGGLDVLGVFAHLANGVGVEVGYVAEVMLEGV